jgi:type II secretory pathway pseudopilin PulG
VVIGIIAILIGLLVTVIPRVKKAVYAAQTSAQLSALSNAIQQYYGDFKAYPGPLANNQLGSAYDPSGNPIYPTAAGRQLTGINGITLTTTQLGHITGTQNLTLGLLGGLEVSATVNANTLVTTPAFVYNPLDIFPDHTHPGPVGAASLNPNNPRRQQSYIQVRTGDISLPLMSYNNGSGASFADGAGRSPTDAAIPVFMDKYPDPLPILYTRTNVGGAAIVGVRNTDGNGNPLVDSAAQGNGYTVPEQPQYDLCQVFDYTMSTIGVTNNSIHNHHGLVGVGQFLVDTIDSNAPGGSTVNGYAPTGEGGKNGIAYFRDPNFKVVTTDSSGNSNYDPLASNTHAGVAREKNGFLLISAGPDRVYGTSDDIIFPGSLLVPQ